MDPRWTDPHSRDSDVFGDGGRGAGGGLAGQAPSPGRTRGTPWPWTLDLVWLDRGSLRLAATRL